MNLIQENESKELYEIQKKLLQDIKVTGNSDDIIRLALLQTFPPIGEYESAMKVLDYYRVDYEDVRILLIGAYMSATFDYEDNYSFLDTLIVNLQKYDKEIQSMIYYIKALYMRSRECKKQDVVENLNKSIQLCGNWVHNYLELSRYIQSDEREKLIAVAKKNVKQVLTEKKLQQYTDFELLDPTFYIDYSIKGIILDEYSFDELS